MASFTFATTPAPPAATIGTAYTYDFSALVSSGISPYTFSLILTGSLPTGLALNATTGVVSGTPTTPGTYTFTIEVEDSATPTPNVLSNPFTIVASYAPISITPLPVSPATKLFIRAGQTRQFTATGGSGNLAFTTSLGEISPSGLFIAPNVAGEGNISVTDKISGLSSLVNIVVESGAGLCLGAANISC